MIKGMGFISNNYGGETKIVMVHPNDIAAAAAEELVKINSSEQVRYVASGEYAAHEAAKILGDAIGKPGLEWKLSSNQEMQDGLEHVGFPAKIAALFVEMGDSIRTGIIRQDYDKHPSGTSGKISLEDFAAEFAVAYSA